MKQKTQKRKKRKLNFKRILFLILFIVAIIYIYNKSNNNQIIDKSPLPNIFNNSDYKTIKQDKNDNYSGIGQEKVKNKDGYFTTFTTEEKNKKTYIEYKQNGNSSWANKEYWGGTMAEKGCGITVMSTILSGYNKKYTPDDLREKYYPVIDYDKLSKELSSVYGIDNSDFYYDSVHLSDKKIVEHLKTNRPIIICVWNKPNENRWTTTSHYMALLATDGKGMVYVSNPNGGENNSKSSGWYELDEVIPYIAKALYIEKY